MTQQHSQRYDNQGCHDPKDDYACSRLTVNRHRRLAGREGSAMPWLSDTKWKSDRVVIGADDDPADAMK